MLVCKQYLIKHQYTNKQPSFIKLKINNLTINLSLSYTLDMFFLNDHRAFYSSFPPILAW